MEKQNMLKALGLAIDKKPMLTETKGRILNFHALMYITKGHGFFEDERTGRREVLPGTLFYLYPKMWHYFDPDPGTAWNEYWILFDGNAVQEHFGKLIPEKKHIHMIGLDQSIIETYESLFNIWFYQASGSAEYSCFLLHKLLVEVYGKINKTASVKSNSFILEMKSTMQHNIEKEKFDFRKAAAAKGMGYENFRKTFKKETGFSPQEYFLMLKINKAKEELLKDKLNIKEISCGLGFRDQYYFSKIFKSKEGVSPKRFKTDNLVPHRKDKKTFESWLFLDKRRG